MCVCCVCLRLCVWCVGVRLYLVCGCASVCGAWCTDVRLHVLRQRATNSNTVVATEDSRALNKSTVPRDQ